MPNGKLLSEVTLEELYNRAGFIESWGRGIEKISTLCKEYCIPEPEYKGIPVRLSEFL